MIKSDLLQIELSKSMLWFSVGLVPSKKIANLLARRQTKISKKANFKLKLFTSLRTTYKKATILENT